jgi:tRNA/tmRNA/rRNA uracil-C5-methylase (TrmA/RlmC/RlmD family)
MTFAETLRRVAERRALPLPPNNHPEPLAALPYETELAVKREALRDYWQAEGLPGRPEPVIGAVTPRGYRTTSKRRALKGRGGLALNFPGSARSRPGVAPSALDLREHSAVYEFLLERLSRVASRPLASVLNWVVIRGIPGNLAVILNLRIFDAKVVRAAKQVGEALQESSLGVRAGFLYLDPSGSEYYLEARRPDAVVTDKRLFGSESLQIELETMRLRYPATVFSQVNSAMLPVMIDATRQLLAPEPESALLDLYCGYGLFSLVIGRAMAQVTGIDADEAAIDAARANARRLACADRIHFRAGRIDGAFLATRLRPPSIPEIVLLDPPRQGTAPEVARVVAEREPRRVVHLCCGTDQIPREITAWYRAGYGVERVVPLDLFAGTMGLETLLLLTPRNRPAASSSPAPRNRPAASNSPAPRNRPAADVSLPPSPRAAGPRTRTKAPRTRR